LQQLSGLDAAFLYMETPSQFGHVSTLSVYARPEAPGYNPYAAWRTEIERRLHLLEPLRRRLINVPLGLDHPFWIEDPNFDLDFHVRHTAVPQPGNDEQLANLVARIIARPLDRSRPLWLSYVIEGLAGDRFAVLTLVHHATIDGAAGVELLTTMLDQSPEGDPIPAAAARWRPEPVPTDVQVLNRAGLNLMRKPGRAILLGARTAIEIGQATRNPALVAVASRLRAGLRGPLGSLLNLGRRRDDDRDPPPRLPSLRPPRTPFNRPITPHRRFAFRSVPLDTVKLVKNALDVTVNDVVMAACAGGLRSWLEIHDVLPDQPLVALVPVSLRTDEDRGTWANRLSMLATVLPTNERDPIERVRQVHGAMASSKALFNALPADRLTDFAEFPPPAVFARAMRLSARLRLGERLLPGNLIISNVPGPRASLYTAGARMLHYYPVSTITEGQGLNITVQSYMDRLDFGLVSCRELVPDLDVLLDAMISDIDGLADAVTGVSDQVARSL
jgi:WS/DGAT/MGAT family acyltransferase